MIETLILSFTLIGVVYFSCVYIWIVSSILWMEHQVYQGIVCVAQQREIKQCKDTAIKYIKRFTSLGEINSLTIKKRYNHWEGYILWNFYNKNFFIRQSFYLSE